MPVPPDMDRHAPGEPPGEADRLRDELAEARDEAGELRVALARVEERLAAAEARDAERLASLERERARGDRLEGRLGAELARRADPCCSSCSKRCGAGGSPRLSGRLVQRATADRRG